MSEIRANKKIYCHYCGKVCKTDLISVEDKFFCGFECRTDFKNSDKKSSCCTTGQNRIEDKNYEKQFPAIFDYLDDEDIQEKLLDFKDNELSIVSFNIPGIRCASCVQVLEKLYKIDNRILNSAVDFPCKKISIEFNHNLISLKQVAAVLSSLGYEPAINPDDNDRLSKKNNPENKKLITRIGVAGFCLGNIMLFSFPEYLGINGAGEPGLKAFFNFLNLIFSIPVIFYCGSVYFNSAITGLKHKIINIDFPISLGLAALFFRSVYEIILYGNAGFIDSLAGLIFLLLIGKLFQNKTFDFLNFERDYKSYFPVSVSIINEDKILSIPIGKLKTGDRILIRNNEIIPADTILFKGAANIDYSFVTGESIPEQKVLGEIIYAGGRHTGAALELEVIRTVSQSYIARLWNDDAFQKKNESVISNISDFAGTYFTLAVLLIAIGSALYWLKEDSSLALDAFTTVLIVACPCALALTAPFALGNTLRIFGRNKFYLKNPEVIEKLAKIDSVVFDKTGTITNSGKISVRFVGSDLALCELAMVKSLVKNSSHPLSLKIHDTINLKDIFFAEEFEESLGDGISGMINGHRLRMGNIRFVLDDYKFKPDEIKHEQNSNSISTNVFLSINNQIKGYFSFDNQYRNGIENLADDLITGKIGISVISGDNDSEKSNLTKLFGSDSKLLFRQNPADKLNFVKSLQKKGKKIMMIGDGLNDAGALKQSDVGVAISEDITNFSPACDAIMDARVFSNIYEFLKFSKITVKIIKVSFGISFMYNLIGLSLAAQGIFSPMIAAILMPVNSISIILIVIGLTNFFAKRSKLL